MRALIRKNVHIWGFGKAFVLFLGCLVFSLSERVNTPLSFEQYLLSAVSDHYYLTYFMLPLVLLSVFPFIEDDSPLTISRFGSYHAYFSQKWLGLGVIAAVLLCVQTAAVLSSGVGLFSGNQWGIKGSSGQAELFEYLQHCFSSPLQAFLLCSVYQFFGTWMVFGLFLWMGHFWKRRCVARIIIVLYLLAAFWIKAPILQDMPFTGLNHLLILHHNIGTPHRFLITCLTVCAMVSVILVSVRGFWRGGNITFPKRHHGIAPYYRRQLMTSRNFLILCIAAAVIILYKRLRISGSIPDEEWINYLFWGHGTGYFQILPFLEMLIVNGVPLYLLAVFTEQTVNGKSLFLLTRVKNRKKLMGGILSVCGQFLFLYTAIWFLGAVISSCVFGGGIHIISGKILLFALTMKFLDTMLQFLIMFAVYLLCRQITAGFLVLLAGNLLCVIPVPGTAYLPLGLSCTARIGLFETEAGIPALTAIGILVFALVLMLGWLLKYGYKK